MLLCDTPSIDGSHGATLVYPSGMTSTLMTDRPVARVSVHVIALLNADHWAISVSESRNVSAIIHAAATPVG